MKNSKLIIIVVLLYSIHLYVNGQNYSQIDTVYYITLQSKLENGRPAFTQLVMKDISTIKNMSGDGLICNIIKSGIYVKEPYTGFLEMVNYFGNNSENETRIFKKKLSRLNKNLKDVFSLSDSQFGEIKISAIKTVSEFWVIDTNMEQINNISDSFQILPECYKHSKYYKFKKIFEVRALNKKEISAINK